MRTMMFGKKKNITNKLSGWTDDMLTEMLEVRSCTPSGRNFTLIVKQCRKNVEITNYGAEPEIKFDASLASEKNSPLRDTNITIRFISDEVRYGDAGKIPEEAVGYALFNDIKDMFGNPVSPGLEVILIANSNTQECIVKDFERTKRFGNDSLPICVWLDMQSIEDLSVKEVVNAGTAIPIMNCDYQQILSINGAVPQDDMYRSVEHTGNSSKFFST